MKNQKLRYGLLLSVMTGLAIFYFYPKIASSPNEYLFYPHGDGLKNYYTVGFHANFDTTFRVNASHYPYGELNIYTDNQPIVSQCLLYINKVVDISDHMIGIINALCLLSIFFAALLLYLILLHFNIHPWLSAIGGFLIAFLAPQIWRFHGHYSLSYVFFIPIVLYAVIKTMDKKSKIGPSILLFASLIIQSFVHTYFLFIGICFVSAVAFLIMLSRRTDKWNSVIALLGPLTFAAIIFLLYNQVYDHVLDRPAFPWGISHYVASFAGTFLPDYGPIAAFIKSSISEYTINGEARAYVGIACILALISGLLLRTKQLVKPLGSLEVVVFASILVWIFGTNIINELTGFVLYDIVPKFRQFRGLARLAWVLYFAFGLYAIKSIHLLIKSKNKFSLPFAVLLLTIWIFEVHTYNTYISKKVTHENHLLSKENNVVYQQVEKNISEIKDYQAILLLPYYFIGNEKFGIQRQIDGMWEAISLSYLTGIPLINHLGSRTSIGESTTNYQLFKDSIIVKESLKHFDDRNILIMSNDAKLSFGEPSLVALADTICHVGNYSFYSLPVKRLVNQSKNVLAHFSFHEDSLFNKNGLSVLHADSTIDIMLQTYDSHQSELALFGKGSQVIKRKEHIPVNLKMSTEKTQISFWTYLDPQDSTLPIFFAKWMSDSQKLLKLSKLDYTSDPTTYRGWIRITMDIPRALKPNKLLFYCENMDTRIDNLWVSPKDKIVYQKIKDEVLLLNNTPIKVYK